MKSMTTNLALGANPDIMHPHSDKLHEMKREAGYVKEESRFFIRLLQQSTHYSAKNKKKEIAQLTKTFDHFLSEDQRSMEKMIRSGLAAGSQEKPQPMIHVNQKWKNFSDKFRQLKSKAMALLGDFFVVRFE